MELRPPVVAFAIGFGVVLAFFGGAVVAPPDPFSQVLVAGVLLPVVVPVVYWVFFETGVGDHERESGGPLRFLVAATVAGTAVTLAVSAVATDGFLALFVRGLAFLATVLAVAWLIVRHEAGNVGRSRNA